MSRTIDGVDPSLTGIGTCVLAMKPARPCLSIFVLSAILALPTPSSTYFPAPHLNSFSTFLGTTARPGCDESVRGTPDEQESSSFARSKTSAFEELRKVRISLEAVSSNGNGGGRSGVGPLYN
ncbi:unnamed protein product [Bathycoccus prasinos]